MKQIFTYLMLCFPFLTFSQSNYKKGLVVKTDGSFLEGYIDYREWSKSPKFFSFKKSEQAAIIKFYPDSVKSFEISAIESYVKFSGNISMNSTQLTSIPAFLDTSTINTSIFVKQIAEGENVSLYTHVDDIKTRYFIKDKDQEIQELGFYNYLDSYNREVKNTPYKNQLFTIAAKCNKENIVTDILNNYPFNFTTLIKVVDLINNKSAVNKSNSGTRFFAGIALNQSETKFEGNNPFALAKSSIDYLPKINIGLDLIANKIIQKLIFRGELSFTAISPKFARTVDYAGIISTETYIFSQYTTALTPQVIYNVYNTQNLKFFLNAGISINLSSYNTKITKSENANYTVFTTPYKFESFWYSFPVKAGLVLNRKVELYASYTYPNQYSNYSDFSVSTQILSAGINYYFNTKH